MFQGKYRIASTRLADWDYTQTGAYFVTICTHNRQCHFGRIVDGQMQFTQAGEIVASEWQRTPSVRSNVTLDAWVVMPNHLHGIVLIQNDGLAHTTEADHVARLRAGSLGAIVGQIKSVCKKRIKAAAAPAFDWQPRFHDHIIRHDADLRRIREYIVNNPMQWELDELYSAD